ncbi:MAG TPA: glucokinase [Chloroflexota bacterium]|nr:glucokinase [Chloroflexota bacterium]
MLLAGDIGGTKTDLAVFSTEAGPRKPLAQAEFPSSQYSSLEEIVRKFLSQNSFPIDRACFDVAGPVIGGRVKTTNLPWVVEEAKLAQEMDISTVRLLNDLEAIALAVPILEPDDLETLNSGEPVKGGSVAVIAPGTGLGQAFLTWDGHGYRAYASEGGHADFAPTNTIQIGLLQYLQERFGHVSYERVCSGIGIPSIYEYLRDRAYAPESSALAARLAATTDRTPLIVESAVRQGEPDALSLATIQTFVDVLGAEAGNLALKVLATGGVYLGGGMPLHVLPILKNGRFLKAFQDKGRFAELLARMPIHVITCRAALVGVAHYGLDMPSK